MAIDVPPALTGMTTMGVLSRKHIVELRQAAPNDRGNRLDVAIRLSGLRQGHIARALNVPQSVISNVKLGRRNKVTVEFANRCAAFFGCTADDLFPAEHIIQRFAALPDLSRPVERPRSAAAGTKRRRRGQRSSPPLVYPLPDHLEKQRLAVIEMLTDARLAQSMTLQELADRLHRTRQQIEQWESAARHVRIDSLMEWADALGLQLCLESIQSRRQ
jgi:transcriptional regulator with XRE-family HTH domain